MIKASGWRHLIFRWLSIGIGNDVAVYIPLNAVQLLGTTAARNVRGAWRCRKKQPVTLQSRKLVPSSHTTAHAGKRSSSRIITKEHKYYNKGEACSTWVLHVVFVFILMSGKIKISQGTGISEENNVHLSVLPLLLLDKSHLLQNASASQVSFLF